MAKLQKVTISKMKPFFPGYKRRKRQAAETTTEPLVISFLQFKTADEKHAGMYGGWLGGGSFRLTVSGPTSTCRTNKLNNGHNNWERGQVDTFSGHEIGECFRADVGQSPATEYPVEVVLQHAGSNAGKVEWIRINSAAGEQFECAVGETLDDDDAGSYQCRRHGMTADAENQVEELVKQSTVSNVDAAATNSDAWTAGVTDSNQWVGVSFARPATVYGFVLRGSSRSLSYVTSYHVLHSWDGVAYSYVEDGAGRPRLFRGAADPLSAVTVMLDYPVEARYVRIVPQTWVGQIALSFDLLGCAPAGTTAGPPTDMEDGSWYTVIPCGLNPVRLKFFSVTSMGS